MRERPPDGQHGTEGGHVEGGIQPGDEPHAQRDQRAPPHERPVRREGHVGIDIPGEGRAGQTADEAERREVGGKRDGDGLGQQREAQRRDAGAQNLLQIDEFHPYGGQRRGEIDEVDRGDDDDQHGDGQQDVGHPAVALGREVVEDVAGEVDVADAGQPHADLLRAVKGTDAAVHLRGDLVMRGRRIEADETHVVVGRPEGLEIGIGAAPANPVREDRIGRQVCIYAADRAGLPADPDDPPHGRFVAEHAPRQRPGQQQPRGGVQSGGVAFGETQPQNTHEGGIAPLHRLAEEPALAVRLGDLQLQPGAQHLQRRSRLDMGRGACQVGNQRIVQHREPGVGQLRRAHLDPEDPFGAGVTRIEPVFETHLDQDDEKGGEGHGQTRDVERDGRRIAAQRREEVFQNDTHGGRIRSQRLRISTSFAP